jgi:histidinol-phosphatase (PHP family)
LLRTHRIFEINTGAISRGYRATPYPSAEIIAYLKQRGAILLLSSDSHSKETLAFQFDMWDNLL